MTKELLTQWVFNQKDTIDKCIQQASYQYWNDTNQRDNIIFDINESSKRFSSLILDKLIFS